MYVRILSPWEVWRALKRLELLSAAPRATLTPLSCSPNFPLAQYLDILTLTHELIVDDNRTSCRPIRLVIILGDQTNRTPGTWSLMTRIRLRSTQSYYHYEMLRHILKSTPSLSKIHGNHLCRKWPWFSWLKNLFALPLFSFSKLVINQTLEWY